MSIITGHRMTGDKQNLVMLLMIGFGDRRTWFIMVNVYRTGDLQNFMVYMYGDMIASPNGYKIIIKFGDLPRS